MTAEESRAWGAFYVKLLRLAEQIRQEAAGPVESQPAEQPPAARPGESPAGTENQQKAVSNGKN